jgi:transposase
VLFQDEKGPIAAKTYGGNSWCSTQAKIERAQKTKGILNVFGIYGYTNDEMFTHCYKKKKNSKQFIDFIQRVDSLYDSNIKTIFLILDNISIHKSKKVREVLSRYHHRITLVFLPTKSPELNLIEVRWMWLQRIAINNSTFRGEPEIGNAVQDWTDNYNIIHSRRIIDTSDVYEQMERIL